MLFKLFETPVRREECGQRVLLGPSLVCLVVNELVVLHGTWRKIVRVNMPK